MLLVEVNEASARELARRLEGYSGFRVGRGLEPLESGRGLFNALFLPQPPRLTLVRAAEERTRRLRG